MLSELSMSLVDTVKHSEAIPRQGRDGYAKLCASTILLAINDGARNPHRAEPQQKREIESAIWFLFHPNSHIHLMAEYLNMSQEQIVKWVMENKSNYKMRQLRMNAMNVGGREQLLTWKYYETQRRTNH